MLDELGTLYSWLNEGQHAMLVLLGITAWYAYLTHRIAKSSALQAKAVLQPILALQMNFNNDDIQPAGDFEVINLGSHPAVLLDVRLFCYAQGSQPVMLPFAGLDEQIVRADSSVKCKFDINTKVPTRAIQQGAFSYRLVVVASDLSRRVAAVYEILPVVGRRTCRLGMPLRVRAKYRARPLKWGYYRMKDWIMAKWRCVRPKPGRTQ